MENKNLTHRIQNEVDAIIGSVKNISEADFFQQPHPEKWSIGQNIQHLLQSSKPLVKLFGQPEMMNQWAKSNRASQDYEAVKTQYTNALQTPPPFLLAYRHIDTEGSKTELLDNLKSVTSKLVERARLMSESDLDTYQIPHPLIGLLTAREFLHFTAYHTIHHHGIIQKIMSDVS